MRVDSAGTLRARDPIMALAGGASAALGIGVLLGWHLNIPRLMRVFPDFTPMAYNTAISFAVLGFGLASLAFGRRWAARLAAGMAGLIGLTRLLQSATGVPQGFETIVSRFTLPQPAVAAVPIAPNTAVAFVLTAAAVWLCSARRDFRGKAMAIAFCGSGSAALGLNAFAGYLAGLQTYIWGHFRPMAVHTSVGLIVLGAPLVAFSWREARGVGKDTRACGLVMIAMAGAVTSFSFWQALSLVEWLRVESVIRFRSVLPETVLVFGLLMTLLLATAVYLAQTARRRTALAERLRLDAERALAALGVSERTYRTLLESLPQKIAHKNRDSVYLSCNENYARDLSLTPDAVAGKTDFDLYPGEFAEKYRADDRRVMESGVPAVIEEEYLLRGQRQWVQTMKAPVRDERGEVAGVIVIFWDISEQKRAREELKRAGSYNRSLIEASLDPLVTIAANGKITDVNRATEEVTGCPRQQLIGTDFSDYFTDPEKARRGYEQAFREGAVQDYELEIRREDGRLTPVLYNAAVYRDEIQAAAGVFAAARDITGRKRAEEALAQKARDLERSNADLEQFAYVASHDLQEPLRMVANFTQLLADRYGAQVGAEGAEFVAYAVDGAKRMQRLIQDLLAYSRVGTRGKAFEPADCNEILGVAIANLQAAIEESGALVTHEELPAVTADSSQLAQLFQNLLGNAIKFHGAGTPRVHVSARREAARWVFAVRDNGIGIAPEFADRIFLIFQRLHGRVEYPGTGIGLAVCKKIVERHGGRIWVESEPGKGATFLFTIPVV